ncbi:MAG TPA: acyl-CoA dehydrogenase family protein [Fimbriimonadaceae bacterium]|nr:acyl-CoA dehydrogenase family protein [Fimbriimonadaceae bacterium]
MYKLNSEQQKIVDSARQIARDVVEPRAASVDQNSSFPRESIDALAKAGLLGLNVPTEFEGLGQGLGTIAAVLDEVAQHCASTAMVYLMHLCGVACYAAKPEVAGKQLRDSAAGKHLSTLAWSERGSRSHFWAPVSQAAASNGHIVLNAEKSFVTSAGEADGYVVSTRTAGGTAPTDTMLYLVLKEDEGMAASGTWNALGMRGNRSAPMKLSNVNVTPERALSDPSQGFTSMLQTVLPVFTIGNAAISVGVSEAAVASTTSHLTGAGFQHLGSRLADLPNLRARLAQMRIETDRSRAHLASVIESVETGSPAAMLMILESKAAAGDAALTITDLGMKTCGGAAFGKHLSVERNFRDARAMSVMAPTSDVLHDFIGKALCGMELF